MFRSLGIRTSVKNSQDGDWQPAAAPRRSVSLGIDVPLLLILATLLIFGLLMLYSASYDVSRTIYKNPSEVFLRQVLWLAIGLAGATFLALFDYRHFRRLIVPAMGITVASLVLVLVVNEVRYNAVRTLLGGSIQPSELAKLVTVIYLSVWLFSKRDNLNSLSLGLLPLGGILGIMGGLIVLQPDLSAVVTILILGGVMFFLAGGDMRQIGLLMILMIGVVLLVVLVNPTGSARLTEFIGGLKDPTQSSYHVRRSLEAFFNGGWLGVGIGNGSTKLTGLPFPHTDSIFAVIGEETGIVGAMSVVCLYALLLWRGLTIARRAPDDLGALLAGGLAFWLTVEAFINMLVMVALLPFAGNALPFISSGGSNLIVSLAAIGIILNVSRRSAQGQDETRRSLFEVVDLRGRDRRRRVSRADRVGRAKSD